jgi:hypothetical protein
LLDELPRRGVIGVERARPIEDAARLEGVPFRTLLLATEPLHPTQLGR